MKIEYMKELLVLEKHNNYTAASRELYITQPVLSRHISALEEVFDVTLINRNSHKVEFTKEGIETCRIFRQIVELYDAHYLNMCKRRNDFTYTLNIGMLYYTVNADFGNILPAFKNKYPNISIQTISGQPQEIYQAIIDKKIDIGVLAHAEYDRNNLLSFVDVNTSQGCVMVSNEHKFANRTSLYVEELSNESIILLSNDLCSTKSILEAFTRCNTKIRNPIYTDHIDTVPFSILENNAIHVNAMGFSIPGYEQQIQAVPLADSEMYFIKSFVYRKDNNNPAIKLFLNMLK